MPDHNTILDFLKVYKTIYPNQKFVYMSLPITTGPIFIEWYLEVGQYLIKTSTEYKRLHKVSVIDKNIELAEQYAKNLFQSFNSTIINPTQFDPDFSQEEFMIFWDAFIKEYASQVVFCPGWALSKGSLAEYIISLNADIKRWQYDYQSDSVSILNKEEAVKQITEAGEYLTSVGFNAHMQENILKLL